VRGAIRREPVERRSELESHLIALSVVTPYGIHIRLDRCIEGRPLPFEAARDRIAAHLEDSGWHHAAQYISCPSAGRRSQASISAEPTRRWCSEVRMFGELIAQLDRPEIAAGALAVLEDKSWNRPSDVMPNLTISPSPTASRGSSEGSWTRPTMKPGCS